MTVPPMTLPFNCCSEVMSLLVTTAVGTMLTSPAMIEAMGPFFTTAENSENGSSLAMSMAPVTTACMVLGALGIAVSCTSRPAFLKNPCD